MPRRNMLAAFELLLKRSDAIKRDWRALAASSPSLPEDEAQLEGMELASAMFEQQKQKH